MSTLSDRLRAQSDGPTWEPVTANEAADELDRLTALSETHRVAAVHATQKCHELDAEIFRLVEDKSRLTARVDALQAELADAVRKTATRCREMALWPQGIDDEQAYYGRMFAEFIEREFKL